MARKPKLGKVEVNEKITTVLDQARGRVPTDVLVISTLPDGTLGIDSSFHHLMANHVLLNRAIFELNVIYMNAMQQLKEQENVQA